MRIALASCLEIPEPDVDESLVLDAFARAGAEAKVLAWDDPAARFSDYDVVVLRSTWNYFERLADFLRWASVTARLRNPFEVVRWNATKTYLRELETRGIDVVPTLFPEPTGRVRLRDVPWRDIVVKPVTSAGSYRTERFERDDPRGQTFLDEHVSTGMMIQKWMPAVNDYGERSLVWIDGEITHAIRKSPRFAGDVENVSGEMPITPEERAFAERVIEASGAKDLLYGRVDIIRDEQDVLRVMELELIEPSLFFKQCPRALDRFVESTMNVVRRS